MADKRIAELNALTVTASTDEALVSDTSALETKKVTIENLFKTPYVGTPQALSGAGSTVVANITAPITNCTSTGAAQVISLADGAQGQVKICSHTVDGGDVRITPANLDGGVMLHWMLLVILLFFFSMMVHGRLSVDMDIL